MRNDHPVVKLYRTAVEANGGKVVEATPGGRHILIDVVTKAGRAFRMTAPRRAKGFDRHNIPNYVRQEMKRADR